MAAQNDTPKQPDAAIPDSSNSTTSTTQRVVEDLRERIIQGKIPPGEKLKIESLKTLLDSGASPIREALSLLTSDQLVERIDQRGFRVAPANADHFREILMLRCQVDIIGLKRSIDLGGLTWEETITTSHKNLSRASTGKGKNTGLTESFHKAFHLALLSACNSPILLRFCEQLYDLNIRYRYLAGSSGSYATRDVEKEHKEIMDAALDRNTELAVSRLMSHYTLTGEFLADQFE